MNRIGLFLVCIMLLTSFLVVFPVENVKAPPTIKAYASASPTTVVVGENVSFTGSATGGTTPYKWDWNFRDGQTSNLQNPTHSYSTSDTYTAILNVTDYNNYTDTDTVIITVNPALSCDAHGPYTGTICSVVQFAGTATGGHPPYTYSWTFGDGGSGSGQNPTYQYTIDDSYTATLTVTDNQAAQAVDTSPVTITTSALVAEAGGPYTGTKCNPVSFSGSASGGCPGYTYSWVFGDGGTGTGQNPSNQYTIDDSYTATLTVTDNQGNTFTDTASVTISTPTLVADANGPYNGKPGQSINFIGSAIGGCTPYSYSWDFGDGNSSTLQNASHSYTNYGNYIVTLTVTDNGGLKDNQTYEVVVVYVDSESPSKVTGLSVTNAKDGKLNLVWNTATDNIAVDHYKIYRNNVFLLNRTLTSYQDTGLINGQSYTYMVSAVDTYGNEGNKSNPVPGIPTQSSSGGGGGGGGGSGESDSTSPTTPTNVKCITQVNDTTPSFNWTKSTDASSISGYYVKIDNGTDTLIGNVTSWTSTNVIANGTHTFYVKAKDASSNGNIGSYGSCSFTINMTVVLKRPIADAGGPYSGLTYKEITFDGFNSTDIDGTIVGYRWDWTNDSTYDTDWLTTATTKHTYLVAGNYTVKLKVKDNTNVTATDTVTVDIIENTDDDDDGLIDVVEIQLGSDPNNKSDVTRIDIVGTTCYLVDTNKNGQIDMFCNQNINKSTKLGFEDGKYLIDINGDGSWDYTYDFALGITAYQKKEEDKGLPGFELILILCAIMVSILLWKKKRNT